MTIRLRTLVFTLILASSYLIAVLMGSPAPPQDQASKITWSPKTYEAVLLSGTSQATVIKFVTASAVQDFSLFVTPELSGLLTLQSIGQGSLNAGEHSVTAILAAPLSQLPGLLEGTVHARSGHKTIPQTLKVSIQVIKATNTAIPNEPTSPSLDRITFYDGEQRVVKDELVVLLKLDTPDPAQAITNIAKDTAGVIIGSVPDTLTYQLQFRNRDLDDLESIRQRIETMPNVESASLSFLGGSLKIPNDTKYDSWDEASPAGNNWSLEYIRAPSAWDITTGVPSVKVAVIDGDFQLDHEDLAGNIVYSSGVPSLKYEGHGTLVAGVIGAIGNNRTGIAGVAWRCSLRLYDWRDGEIGVTSPRAVAPKMQKAMLQAARDGARIVNISDGFPEQGLTLSDNAAQKVVDNVTPILARALQMAQHENHDVLWIFAAGNEHRDAKYACPANLTRRFPSNTITVAAISRDRKLADFSNTGDLVTLAAPGEGILTNKKTIKCAFFDPFCVSQPAYDSDFSGTSAAAPHVAGVAALVLSAHPNFSAAQARTCITNTAQHAVPGHNFRVIDAAAAVGCQTAPQVTLFFDGSTDSRFQNSIFTGKPEVDSRDNLLAVTVGLQSRVVRINSFSASASLNWQTNNMTLGAAGSFPSLLPLTLGPSDTVYFAPNGNTVHAFDSFGLPVSGWPVHFDTSSVDCCFVTTTDSRFLAVDNSDGTVYARLVAPGFPPNETVISAFRPDGSLKWLYESSHSPGTKPVIGPARDIYASIDSGLWAFDHGSGLPICKNIGGPYFFDGIHGGLDGVFTGFGNTIVKFDENCNHKVIHTTPLVSITPLMYVNGTVFAYAFSQTASNGSLVAVSKDGTLLWRTSQVAPIDSALGNPIRQIRSGIVYALGLDTLDGNKQKLFLIDEVSGAVFDTMETASLCSRCDLAVDSNKTIYLVDLTSTKIHRIR